MEKGGTKKILVIGASGAIGKLLTLKLVKEYGPFSVIAALHRSALPENLSNVVINEFEFDIRNQPSIDKVLSKHHENIHAIWNLAAPLSLDTANDPSSAYDITVGGIKNLLQSMKKFGLNRIYFSDSLASYGTRAPREEVTVDWLIANPSQDPGSDYGIQKRQCRELLYEYSSLYGFDTRFIIIPGVLHSQPTWGNGTTEYALDAILAAYHRKHYICPINLNNRLPMIYIDDLTRGMILLDKQPLASLRPSAQWGYALTGYTFSPLQLFQLLQSHVPSFTYSCDETINPNANHFSSIWPQSLSAIEAKTDLCYQPEFDLEATVACILADHARRAASGSL